MAISASHTSYTFKDEFYCARTLTKEYLTTLTKNCANHTHKEISNRTHKEISNHVMSKGEPHQTATLLYSKPSQLWADTQRWIRHTVEPWYGPVEDGSVRL